VWVPSGGSEIFLPPAHPKDTGNREKENEGEGKKEYLGGTIVNGTPIIVSKDGQRTKVDRGLGSQTNLVEMKTDRV